MTINASAQTSTYETTRNKVVEDLRGGDFANAKSRLNLMGPDVNEFNETEYNSLLSQLQDSINGVYQRANSLMKKKQYQRAIVEYQRLIGRGKEPLIKPLYAHIGYCHEMLSNYELAVSNYQIGKQYNESLSKRRLKSLKDSLPKNDPKPADIGVRSTFNNILNNNYKVQDKELDSGNTSSTIGHTQPRHDSKRSRPYRSSWGDFVDTFTSKDETWGIGYNYSESFPLALSLNYTYHCLSVGVEIGANLNGKKYTTNQYDPLGYLTISPGLYCRYLSMNCGIGFLISNYTKIETWGNSYTEEFSGGNNDSSVSYNGSSTTIISGSTSTETNKYHLIIKPSITGYIPISDEYYYITINVGYNYLPKFKELNGWSFGVGFQWVI